MSIGQIFKTPDEKFPARTIATDITVLVNQTVEKIIGDIKYAYHQTWAVSGPLSGASRTQDEQQQVMDKMDLVSLAQMREASFAIVTVIRNLCIALAGKEVADEIVPVCYLETAWELTTEGTFGQPDFRVIVGPLKPEWVKPPEEEVTE